RRVVHVVNVVFVLAPDADGHHFAATAFGDGEAQRYRRWFLLFALLTNRCFTIIYALHFKKSLLSYPLDKLFQFGTRNVFFIDNQPAVDAFKFFDEPPVIFNMYKIAQYRIDAAVISAANQFYIDVSLFYLLFRFFLFFGFFSAKSPPG